MIYINGGTKNQRRYAESLAEFVFNKFGIDPDVEINFRRMTNENAVGGCVELEDHEYEVDVKRSLRMREMLVTLAHELVHVKQYETGTLTQDNETGIDYWDRPSEIEAHGRETGLFVRWAEANNLAHLKWTHETH
jgi:hypothetical protein